MLRCSLSLPSSLEKMCVSGDVYVSVVLYTPVVQFHLTGLLVLHPLLSCAVKIRQVPDARHLAGRRVLKI